ncbi:MAG: hypothetical protein E5Y02_10430 [Mesorhizobium sp.]|nr:MAG: hypothetical protein E5Y02_10430 [Mesorhizobium sp.]
MGAFIDRISPAGMLNDRKVSSWRPWYKAETKRVQQNLARVVISKWERGEREDAERIAAGLKRTGKHFSNQPFLMQALETIYAYQDEDDRLRAPKIERAERLASRAAFRAERDPKKRQAIKDAYAASVNAKIDAAQDAQSIIADRYNDLTDAHWRERKSVSKDERELAAGW